MMDHIIYTSQIRAVRAIHSLLQSVHLPGLLMEAERKGAGTDAELIQRIIDSRIADMEIDHGGQ